MEPNSYDIRTYETCIQAGMTDQFARCLIGQARNESGNWQSQFFLDDNNPFGMNYSQNNPLATPSQTHFNNEGSRPVPYAHYESLEDAIIAQILYFNNEINPSTHYNIAAMQNPIDYCNQLWDNGYFTGNLATLADYVSIVDSYYTRFDQPDFWAGIVAQLQRPASNAGLLAFIAAVALLFFTFKK